MCMDVYVRLGGLTHLELTNTSPSLSITRLHMRVLPVKALVATLGRTFLYAAMTCKCNSDGTGAILMACLKALA